MRQKKYMELNDDGIKLVQLWDSTGKQVAFCGNFEKIPDDFKKNTTGNFTKDGLRNIYRKNSLGSAVRLIVDDRSEFFQGTKMVARSCVVYLSMIPRFKQIEHNHRQHFDAIVSRFAHNLVKFQTRFKSNFNRLISDSARERPHAKLKDEVKRRIENNTEAAAEDVCQMSHRAVDLDAQIETLRVISGYSDSQRPDHPTKTDLLKTLHRRINPFIDELGKKSIKVLFNISGSKSSDDKVLIASGLFSAAIWQLFDNASKYVLNGTEIILTADLLSNPQKFEMEMVSVCIEPDEEELVFHEHYKGKHAGSKAVNGIGLYVVRKALKQMGATISVKNEGKVCEDNGYIYCKHRFTIKFALKKQSVSS